MKAKHFIPFIGLMMYLTTHFEIITYLETRNLSTVNQNKKMRMLEYYHAVILLLIVSFLLASVNYIIKHK